MTSTITINSDLGESFGLLSFGHDDELLDLIDAANIACGFHSGDPHVMSSTVAGAARAGVALGAHPGLPDLTGFGRRQMSLSADEVRDLTLYQVGALSAFIDQSGAQLSHIKAHGALYGMLSRDEDLMRPVAELMFIDFMGVCFDQIYNQAAKFRYMFGGKAETPVVIRAMVGIRRPRT